MLPEYSHTELESLAQISTPTAEIQNFFLGDCFYWRILYITQETGRKCSRVAHSAGVRASCRVVCIVCQIQPQHLRINISLKALFHSFTASTMPSFT